MTEDIRTCRNCANCYQEDTAIYTAPSMLKHNVEGACGLINPDDRHVGSFVRLDPERSCRQWTRAIHPIRVHPARTKRMVHDGIWWTDIERARRQERQSKRQRTLEDF